MYQALYRKWRPQIFDDVIGQQHITETLKNQVRSGRLSHAYLFIGTRGTGKTTCARILAKAVNCEHPDGGNPCGVCPACRGITDGSALDVVELDAASNNSVDNVRALREEAVFSPASLKKRVYIIDEVHMLSASAFNALLKILEEPPEHLMFILATTELHKVPATILSRCQRHSFKRIDAETIAAYLEKIAEKEGFRLQHDAAELIARLADGGVRDALSLLDQCSASETIDLDAVYSAMGLAGNRRTLRLMQRILDREADKALRDFSALWMDGKDPVVLLTELTGLLRDALMMKLAPKGGADLISGGYDTASLLSLGERMTKEEILCAMETLQKAQAGIRAGANPKTAAEICLVSLCDSTLGESLASLRSRVSRLEEDLRQIGSTPQKAPAVKASPDTAEEPRPDPAEYSQAQPLPVPGALAAPQPPEPPERVESILPEPAPEPEAPAEGNTAPSPEAPAEEQPAPAPAQAEPAAPAPAAEADGTQAVSWQEIARRAAGQLSRGVSSLLENEASVRGTLEDGRLRIEAEPGFVLSRVSRQDVLAKLSDVATELAGREIRAYAVPLESGAAKPLRNLQELAAFKEVTITY